MFHLIYGNDLNSLKVAILNKVSTLPKNEEIYIVVPEMFTYSSELQVMDFLNLEAMINIKVMSFQRITETLLSKLGGIKRQRIDDVGKTLIIRKLISENPNEFRLYKDMVDKDGFYSKLIALIKEFKNNQVTPETLEMLGTKSNKGITKEKLLEISMIYKGLEEQLAHKYVDNEDRLNQLLEILLDSNVLKGKEVLFWQFSSFSQLEYNIISAIGCMRANLSVGLVYNHEKAKDLDFITSTKTRENLMRIAGELKLDVMEEFGKETFDALQYKYMVAANADEEIDMLAKEIKILLDNGIVHNEIAVVSSIEEYGILIKRMFDEYGIPVLINKKEALMTTAVVSWLRNMLSVIIYNFKYEDVVCFLKSNLNFFSSDEVEGFENFILRKNIRGEMYFKDRYFSDEKFISVGEKEQVIKVREYIIQGFEEIRALKGKKQPLKNIVQLFFETINKFNLVKMIEDFSGKLEEEGLLKESEIIEQSYASIIDIIDQMMELSGDDKINLQGFLNLLESGFRQKQIGAIPQGTAQILFSSIDEGLSGDYKYIFFVGATNEHMPRAQKTNGLFSEQELKEIGEEGVEVRDREILDYEEYHHIYKLLTLPKVCAVFSYAKIGLDGKKQKPSNYLMRFKAAKMDTKTEEWDFKLDPMLNTLSGIMREFVEYGRLREEDLTLLRRAKVTEALADKLKLILLDNSLEKPDFKMEKAKVRLLYGYPLELSVTRIQNINRCEFAHFIKYGLSPREREQALVEPKELGTLLHGFVEDFSNEIKTNPSILNINDDQSIEAIIGELYEKRVETLLSEAKNDSYRTAYLIGKIKRSAYTVGKLLFDQVKNSEFEIREQEIKFGKNQAFPEIDLSVGENKAYVKGQIDRVDTYVEDGKTYIRVIDYKSNGKVFSISDNYNGIDVQLILYMATALDAYKNSVPVGAFYLPLIERQLYIDDNEVEILDEKRRDSYKMDGIALSELEILKKMDNNLGDKNSSMKLKGRGNFEERANILTQREFTGLIDHVKKDIKNKLETLFSGDIKINPYVKADTETGCNFCNYKGICGFDDKHGNGKQRKINEYDVDSIKRKLGGEE